MSINKWCMELSGAELKPCACGERAVLMEIEIPTIDKQMIRMYQIECTKCDCVLGHSLNPDVLINDWNNK